MAAKYVIFEKEKYRDSYARNDFETCALAAEAILSGQFKEKFVIVQRLGITIDFKDDAHAFETKDEREEREEKEAAVRDFDEAIMRAAPKLFTPAPVEIVNEPPAAEAEAIVNGTWVDPEKEFGL